MASLQTLETKVKKSGILEVTLKRPEIRNAFNEILIEELTQTYREAGENPEIRLSVLQGEGPIFCAGGDLNWMKKSVELSREENLKDTQRLSHMFEVLFHFPKPLIGLVQGAAIGGGVGLVSVCDIVLASRETVFSLSEVRLGIVPACIGPFVLSKIGPSHARRYFLSAERFSAEEAYRIGLVHEVVETPDSLIPTLDVLLENMLACGPNAMKAAKKLLMDLSIPEIRNTIGDPGNYVAEMLADLRVSPEGQEGLKAFLEKRKPKWMAQ